MAVRTPSGGIICANPKTATSVKMYYNCNSWISIGLTRLGASSSSTIGYDYVAGTPNLFYNNELAHTIWTQEREPSPSLLSGILGTRALEVSEPSPLILIALGLLGFFFQKGTEKNVLA